MMILSRLKPSNRKKKTEEDNKNRLPEPESFIDARDYVGAITLLEFLLNTEGVKQVKGVPIQLWIAYCAFHNGDYKRAAQEYESITQSKEFGAEVWLYLAICYFMMGMYEEARKCASSAPAGELLTRLMFHLAQKLGDEEQLMAYHKELRDVLEDQLCLASIHYLRSHYQEAIDIYKRLLLNNRHHLALNVYVSMCYYKLDYFDVSQEMLTVYLQRHQDSLTALNLRVCNIYKLHGGRVPEQDLKVLEDAIGGGGTASAAGDARFGADLVRHNMVVFRGGVAALAVLPPLVDVVPEARLNLVIYHLKQDNIEEAFDLMKDLEPSVPQEYILKAVVNAIYGQETGSREHLKLAQQYFQLVGSSTSECDTIPGRQCMASTFFLMKQFEDVLLYLSSVKTYFAQDDAFNFNYAQAKAAVGAYSEAEELLLSIQDDSICSSYVYLSWLVRCYIMNGKPRQAWSIHVKHDGSSHTLNLLTLIANDCYRLAHFHYAARAFDTLDRLDSNPEYWEGKRGACVAMFQMVIAGKLPEQSLGDAIKLLRSSFSPQADSIIKVMEDWARDKGIAL